MRLNQSLFLFISVSIISESFAQVEESCRNGQILGDTNFHDPTFPSLAKIVDSKTNKFICSAVILTKNQLLTAPNCVRGDINRTSNGIRVVLQHFNQKEKIERSVSEIFVHPKWSANGQHEPEMNSAIIITNEKIPFDFFVFTTCFRQYVLQTQNIYQVLVDWPCQKLNRISTDLTVLEIPSSENNGGLYVHHSQKWFIYGFYSSKIIDSKICESKTLPSLSEVHKHFQCANHSKTVAIGSKASTSYCSGELMFEDNFDTLDPSNWRHEHTLAGGGNWEFQWYVPDDENSFIRDKILHIKPTRTDEIFGEKFLYSGTAIISDANCTKREFFGCKRNGRDNLINPIRSASIETINSFAFKYGIVEVRAKMSAGDWLASTITLLPKYNVYGEWPRSGEIDMAETRGNRKLFEGEQNIGVERVGCTLHFGPNPENTKWDEMHSWVDNSTGFNNDFHVFKLKWREESITLYVDDKEVLHMKTQEGGLWEKFKFGEGNPWIDGTELAPFDQEFYLAISLKVGGTKFFPDDDEARNEPNKKPWKNVSGKAAADFWNANDEWLDTWVEDEVDFQIDYVRIYAL